MSNTTILILALLAYFAFDAIVDAVKAVLVARPKPSVGAKAACRSFDVTHAELRASAEGGWEETGRRWVTTYSLAPGGVITMPPGTLVRDGGEKR